MTSPVQLVSDSGYKLVSRRCAFSLQRLASREDADKRCFASGTCTYSPTPLRKFIRFRTSLALKSKLIHAENTDADNRKAAFSIDKHRSRVCTCVRLLLVLKCVSSLTELVRSST